MRHCSNRRSRTGPILTSKSSRARRCRRSWITCIAPRSLRPQATEALSRNEAGNALRSMNRRTILEKETIMRIVVACGIALVSVALLQPAEAGLFGEKKVLTLEIARIIVTAAELEATRNHLAGVVAVVDD